jgi:hypothetical protein
MLGDDVAYLLEDFGSDLTLTRRNAGAYDPTIGTVVSGNPTLYTLRGVFINYMDANVDGTVVRMGDRRLLIKASGATFTPRVGDRVSGLQVIDVRTIAPNGVAIAWSCQMRGTGDEAPSWLLSTGAWSDTGIWDDSATWSDAA